MSNMNTAVFTHVVNDTAITVYQQADTGQHMVSLDDRIMLFFEDRADLQRLHDAIGAHLTGGAA